MGDRTDRWMPLYIGDYMADTGRLTTEGHGAYLLLLMDYWRNGAPPDDDDILAAITKLAPARWRQLRKMIEPFFQVTDGSWRHKRVDEEMQRAAGVTEERSRAGKEGAAARWNKPDGKQDGNRNGKTDGKRIAKPMANAMANAWQNDAPLQLPIPSQEESLSHLPSLPAARASSGPSDSAGADDHLGEFEEFWRIFPPRSPHGNPKKPAKVKFMALVRSGITAEEILAGAKRYATTVIATRTEPRFVAQAITWLNQERWHDDAATQPPQASPPPVPRASKNIKAGSPEDLKWLEERGLSGDFGTGKGAS